MAEMGQYCKAYLAKDLRQFPGWTENKANVRKEKKEVDGKEVEVDRELDDESILYIQENYVVTDGIFKDENIIFDNVTDEWKQFCHETLQFEIPVYEPIEIPRAETSEGQPEPEPGAAPSTPTPT
jgi:Lhr-like helicase